VGEVIAGLQEQTVAARRGLGRRIAAGLWLAAGVVEELRQYPRQRDALKQVLADGDLVCYSLNAFPFGDFHSERVKEQVYLPDWSDPARLQYTAHCGQILAELMPPGVEGSISTVPLGFKEFAHPAGFLSRCVDQLLALAEQFDQLHDETGQVIRLAIEPEPCCELETTAETLAFFDRLFQIADERHQLEIARRHLGVCYDVCHQAVEFEDIPGSIQQLSAAGIRINKMHLTCALHLEAPGENAAARQELCNFVEPRYLHQTFAKLRAAADSQERIVHQVDLSAALCLEPPEEFRRADAWRIHFHVPVHRESLGALSTTRTELKAGIAAAAALEYAPQLEVETYTWGVLPGEKPATLTQGLINELSATAELLANCPRADAAPENPPENRASE